MSKRRWEVVKTITEWTSMQDVSQVILHKEEKNHEIGRKHYCLEINDEHKEEFFEFRGQIEFD